MRHATFTTLPAACPRGFNRYGANQARTMDKTRHWIDCPRRILLAIACFIRWCNRTRIAFVGGQYGKIKIRDAQGNSHEILHTATQSVTVGHHVNVGDEIGNMGGRGPHCITQYAQHVHYQIKDSQGRPINPETYWNEHAVDMARSNSSAQKAASASNPASSHHVLKQSDQGRAVHDLQANLAKLGYNEGHGQPLKVDGHFGPATQAAVEALQCDHHLTIDGKAGPKTLAALHTELQKQSAHVKATSPGLYDPKNPDHALYEQALAGVR